MGAAGRRDVIKLCLNAFQMIFQVEAKRLEFDTHNRRVSLRSGNKYTQLTSYLGSGWFFWGLNLKCTCWSAWITDALISAGGEFNQENSRVTSERRFNEKHNQEEGGAGF